MISACGTQSKTPGALVKSFDRPIASVVLHTFNPESATITALYESIWVIGKLEVRGPSGALIPIQNAKVSTQTFDDVYIEGTTKSFSLTQIDLSNLIPGRSYTLEMILSSGAHSDDSKEKPITRKQVHQFTTATQKSNLRFVVGSCANSKFSDHVEPIWSSIEKQDPDAILLIGDNFYMDSNLKRFPFQKQWLSSAITTRLQIPTFYKKRLFPVLTIWDDNDFGASDGNRTFKFKEVSTVLYESFFPRSKSKSADRWSQTLGHVVEGSDYQFVFLDNRSSRAPNNDGNSSGEHLGDYQLGKLSQRLSSGKFTWIIEGDQFFGGFHRFESYEGNHPMEFLKFREILKNSKSPFALISGDRHMSSISLLSVADVGINTFEITSSPLYSRLHPGNLDRDKNPRFAEGIDDKMNFVSIDTKRINNEYQIQINSWDEHGNSLFERSLKISK